MLNTKAAASALEHRDGQETRGISKPRTIIVPHRRRLCKPLCRLTGTLSAALLMAACTCLAEGLAGSGLAYFPAALACLLAANGCAGAAFDGTQYIQEEEQ